MKIIQNMLKTNARNAPLNKNNATNAEKGNALWFVLIGIALLATLTITISRSSDTAEQSGDIERYRIQASEAMSFAVGTEQAIKRMKLRGISENALSFANSYLSVSYTNGNCATDDCLIFNKNGGGLSYETPDSRILDPTQTAESHYGEWYFPSEVCVSSIGSGGNTCESDGTNNEELLIVLPWITRGLCIEINKMLDITNPGDLPPQNDDDAFAAGYPVFSGSLANESGIILDAGNILDGELSGCFEGSGVPPTGSYHFYHVLLSR